MTDKKRKKIYTTPKGEARFCHLSKPSTKFKPEGEYDVTLVLEGQEAADLVSLIDQLIDENRVEIQKKDPKFQKRLKEADPPYKDDIDKDGNETGKTLFKFTQKAQATSKKTGEIFTFAPVLYDSKRNVIHPKNVGFGSILRVAFEPYGYNSPSIGAGVSLRLKGVQIIDLSGGGLTAEVCGFEDEDGYLADSNMEDELDFSAPQESSGDSPSNF